jgi:hypothetical protein
MTLHYTLLSIHERERERETEKRRSRERTFFFIIGLEELAR